MKKIPYVNPQNIFKPANFTSSIILTCGPQTEKFEILAAKKTGAKYAIACSSCTIALYCAYRALGLRGKTIAMPSFTWRSTAEAAHMAGAKIKFIDIEKETFCINPDVGECDAIVAVDCFGCPADYQALLQHQKPLIVDSAHSFGSKYHGSKIGRYGIHCYSFSPTKVVTASEGGLITCNDKQFADHIRGIARWAGRLSEIHASCAIAGIKNLPAVLTKKRLIFKRYFQCVAPFGVRMQTIKTKNQSTYKDVVLVLQSKKQRDGLKAFLKKSGVETKIYFSPVHLFSHFRSSSDWDMLVNTMDMYDRSLCMPSWPGVNQKYILELLTVFLKKGGGPCPVGMRHKTNFATGF